MFVGWVIVPAVDIEKFHIVFKYIIKFAILTNVRSIFLIFNGRFPSEKAASLFAAKSCESFAEAGTNVTLLAPRRVGRVVGDPYDYYKVQKNFKIVYLPILDLFGLPFSQRFAFQIGFITFALSCLLYLLFKAAKNDLIYSNESLPIFFSSFFFKNTFYEVHDFPERKMGFYRALFRNLRYVLVTNRWKEREVKSVFNVPSDKIICERNAVDVKEFDIQITKEDARKKLGLPLSASIVVYTGHLYGWKGVDVLAEAARLLPPEILVVFVGGTVSDVKSFKDKYQSIQNISILGHKDHSEMPLWQKAADVLVLPNTAKDMISKYYTSPMKLFEYMASKRPIVASNIPSVTEVLNDSNSILVHPDDAKDIAQGIEKILKSEKEGVLLAEKAYRDVLQHTWERRAERIIQFIDRRD